MVLMIFFMICGVIFGFVLMIEVVVWIVVFIDRWNGCLEGWFCVWVMLFLVEMCSVELL